MTLTQPLLVKMDPRVKTPSESLRAQLDRSMEVAADMSRTLEALRAARAEPSTVQLSELNEKLTSLYTTMQEADMAPTAAMVEAAAELRRRVTEALAAPAR